MRGAALFFFVVFLSCAFPARAREGQSNVKIPPLQLSLYLQSLTAVGAHARESTLKKLKAHPGYGKAVLAAIEDKFRKKLKRFVESDELKGRVARVARIKKLYKELEGRRKAIGIRPPTKGGDPAFVKLVELHEKYFTDYQSFLAAKGSLERELEKLQKGGRLLRNTLGLGSTTRTNQVTGAFAAKLSPELSAFLKQQESYYRLVRRVFLWNRSHTPFAQDYDRTAVNVFNQYRILHGEQPAELEEALHKAARKHSVEMVKMNYFGHSSPIAKNKDWATRIKNENYSGKPFSEDCAMGAFRPSNRTAMACFAMWVYSPGHHRPIRAPQMNQCAVGFAANKATASFGVNTSLLSTGLDVDEFPPEEIKVNYAFMKRVFGGVRAAECSRAKRR